LWRSLRQPFFGTLRQLLIILGNPKHHLLGVAVGHLFRVGARFLGALAPMFRIIKGLRHKIPPQATNTGADLKGLRDRALLLIGFAGALRRSELVALNIEDIEEAPDGIKITIRHSKTDQEGAGQTIAIPFGKIACPVAALKEWIAAAGIGSGALFRSVNRYGKVGERLTDQSVSDVVKEHAERLRLDPKQFAGHSLRAGFLTSAASRGASIFKMMDVSRHRSVDTLRGYVRDAELFKDHAGAGLL
jgi:site-specific recombinase XerD